MPQFVLAIRRSSQSEHLLRWQIAVNVAFVGGSLTAALLNLGAFIAFSFARTALSRFAPALRVEQPHG